MEGTVNITAFLKEAHRQMKKKKVNCDILWMQQTKHCELMCIISFSCILFALLAETRSYIVLSTWIPQLAQISHVWEGIVKKK
jgi:hypothetical protein